MRKYTTSLVSNPNVCYIEMLLLDNIAAACRPWYRDFYDVWFSKLMSKNAWFSMSETLRTVDLR